MKHKVIYLFLMWIVLILGFGLSACLYLLSIPNTICNIIGIAIVFILIFISEKTNCFTNLAYYEKNSNNSDIGSDDSQL